ncbi:MAG: hypothetical protein L0Y37_03365 [Bacteroidales bacterium]|nr:hypothetical protein [Bacteroidales bacterium]
MKVFKFGGASVRDAAGIRNLHDIVAGVREKGEFDHDYDMIVSMGEIWSTRIVESFLRSMGLRTKWYDIRKLFVTDDRYRDAGIIWDRTSATVAGAFSFNDADIYVTQVFH